MGAVCYSGLPGRDEMQSCCANLVTLEITTVISLTDRITLEKDSAKASKEIGVCNMDELMMMRSHVMVLF